MRILTTIEEWQSYRSEIGAARSVGFAPTLGGLHEGHFALMRRSLRENDVAVASIFLNRVQFNKPLDCEKYPAVFADDVSALEAMGVDAVFAPEFDAMYPDDYAYRVAEGALSECLEGAHRPGHFDGVLTVVLKLFNIVRPSRAYFGEKDYQQLQLVAGMVKALFLPVEIVACPTVRSEDGLALSSRNRRLSPEALARAASFPRVLRTSSSGDYAVRELVNLGFEVEYVVDRDGRRFGAVIIEGVRLIDNIDLAEVSKELRRLEAVSD